MYEATLKRVEQLVERGDATPQEKFEAIGQLTEVTLALITGEYAPADPEAMRDTIGSLLAGLEFGAESVPVFEEGPLD
jgi:hypothetical protein